MHESWKAALSDELAKPYVNDLLDFVQRERESQTVFPPKGEVFTALETPFDSVRVVILGQDPYHGPGQAHGLSFSVKPGVVLPPSLLNIYKELKSDVGFTPPGHGCLLDWARQGVLLLNATLTVRAREAGSHQGKGWETLTDEIIRKLSSQNRPLVFVLWGRYARDKKALIDTSKHVIVESAHPSPMSASSGFFGSKPFSKVNTALVSFNERPIDWQIAPLE